MSGDNPIAKASTQRDDHIPWTALQYYNRAVETGQTEKARLWRLEAIKRGELAEPKTLGGPDA